jgi:hypothetical protein
MTWPPELGTDLQFLDGFVDETTMDPSLSMLNDTTNIGASNFLPTTQGLDGTTPFWP